MIIDNTKKAKLIKSVFLFIPLIFTVVALSIIFLDIKNGYYIIAVLAAVMIIMFIAISIKQYRYFYCEITPQKIEFRFHGLGPLNSYFKSYKIKPEHFKGYKITKTTMGLVDKITIYVVVSGEVAKYPPISLSALSESERKTLVNALSNIGKS